jgi:hypothetical protein
MLLLFGTHLENRGGGNSYHIISGSFKLRVPSYKKVEVVKLKTKIAKS